MAKTIFDDIQESNRQTIDGKKVRVKIRIKPKAKAPNQNTVYLDLLVSTAPLNRELKYLKQVIDGRPSRYAEDKATLEIVKAIREAHEKERNTDPDNYTLANGIKRQDFKSFFEELIKIKPRNWEICYKHFKAFSGDESIPFDKIDRKYCIDFAEYLKNIMINNSAKEIYSKFKAVLNEAVKQDKIVKNYASDVSIKTTEVKKEYLTITEIEQLLATPYPSAPTAPETCRAFEFSLRTGLRRSDVINLRFDDIRGDQLYIKQQKTQTVEQTDLADGAIRLIEEQRQRNGNSGSVFNLPSENTIAANIKAWIKQSGIKKKITFHNARHSYVVNALIRGIDIYTVSKMAMHKDLKTTVTSYAKIVSEVKKAAVKKMDF